jgi:hypothetical protein
MKTILLALSLVTFGAFAIDEEPAEEKVGAIIVSFGDYGAGDATTPQQAALGIVGKAILEKKVGLYKLLGVQEHGEISFCVENVPSSETTVETDLTDLYKELHALRPKEGDHYSMSVAKVDDCEGGNHFYCR